MFDQMRKNTKTILWITVGAFIGLILLGWGLQFQAPVKSKVAPGVIGLINGQEIQSAAYENAVSQARSNFQQQYQREVDDRTEAMIREQAWTNTIQETLMRAEAEKRGLMATDQEVVQAVMNQPPPEVMQNPGFQTNGQFDLSKYQAALRNPNVDTRALEDQYRSQLPLQKLQMAVVGSAAVSDEEVWENYQQQNDKIKVSFAMVEASHFTSDPAALSQADVEQFYRAHQREYKVPDEATIDYVEIPRKFTESDSLNVIQLGRQILQEAKGGEDFASLVEAYSEAPANMRGGANGVYLSAGQISDPAIKAAAFNLKPGEVSELMINSGGINIIKLEDRKSDPAGDQVKFAEIFLALKPSPETTSQLRDSATQFRQEVEKRSFAEVAAEMKLSVKQTPPFGEGGFVPGLGPAQGVSDFVFSHPAGAIGPVQETMTGWTVFRVRERKAAHIPDLAEVQDRVRTQAADSLRMNQAEAVAEGLLRQAQAGTPVASLGAGDSRVAHGSPDPFTLLSAPNGIGADPSVIGPLFAASPGLVPHVLRGRAAAYVAVVEQKIPADRSKFEAQKAQLRMRILQGRQSEVFNSWMTALKKSAKIEDYRFGQFAG